ncbi:MAG: DUF1643 domain-containing protein [Dokdonella sp.]|uniref:DUF1643 domain-containing protein n=1 Tax=Dokdonella sp. TaxID=2291710 RepID=UPI003F7DC883
MSAVISSCGRYRYRLQRVQDAARARLLFVMLNPSTADAVVDDPTIRRCIGFARDGGFGVVEVVNLFAYRATAPADLRRAGFPVGPDNDAHIEHALRDADEVCLAWGAAGGDAADARAQVVLPLIRRSGHRPMCLSVTRKGWPAHPLYLPASLRLRPFDQAVDEALGK